MSFVIDASSQDTLNASALSLNDAFMTSTPKSDHTKIELKRSHRFVEILPRDDVTETELLADRDDSVLEKSETTASPNAKKQRLQVPERSFSPTLLTQKSLNEDC